MANKDLSDKIIIVTGASDGIGREIAEELGTQRHATVVLAARRDFLLEEVAEKIRAAGGSALVAPTDLRVSAQIVNLVRRTMETYGRIDVLINVAGMGYYDWIEEQTADEILEQFQTNVIGMADLIRQVVPVMKKQHDGHIINFASYASRIAAPPLTFYSSTKYAVEGLTDGLRRELAPWNIRMTRVHPSAVDTKFNAKAARHGGIEYPYDKITGVTKEQVARKVIAAIGTHRRAVFVSRFRILSELGVTVNRYLPGIIDLAMRSRVPKMWEKHYVHDLQAHASDTAEDQLRIKNA